MRAQLPAPAQLPSLASPLLALVPAAAASAGGALPLELNDTHPTAVFDAGAQVLAFYSASLARASAPGLVLSLTWFERRDAATGALSHSYTTSTYATAGAAAAAVAARRRRGGCVERGGRVGRGGVGALRAAVPKAAATAAAASAASASSAPAFAPPLCRLPCAPSSFSSARTSPISSATRPRSRSRSPFLSQ
jgi:hypothetical protein